MNRNITKTGSIYLPLFSLIMAFLMLIYLFLPFCFSNRSAAIAKSIKSTLRDNIICPESEKVTEEIPQPKPIDSTGIFSKNSIFEQTEVQSEISSPVFDKNMLLCGYENISVYDTKSKTTLTIPLEEYVTMSVICEMPSGFDEQALMAQAIACRTFAIYSARNSGKKEQHFNADVCNNTGHCQAFIKKEDFLQKSASSESVYNKVKQCVDKTRGVIMYYSGNPIIAAFHASNGGKTCSSKEVWGGNVPYLVSVYSYEAENPANPQDKSYIFSKDDFLLKIKSINCDLYNKISNKSILTLEISLSRSDSGRVLSINIDGVEIPAKSFVSAFSLRSANFSIEQYDSYLNIVTHGYGHGVGLSQYGALTMAQKGKNCYEILSHYYPGITFGYVN